MNRIVKKISANPALRTQIVDACAKAGVPLTVQAVNDWKKLKRGVPPSRVTIVSRVLGIPPHEIRPDVFPPPEAAE